MHLSPVDTITKRPLFHHVCPAPPRALTLTLSRPAGEGTRCCLRSNCGDVWGGAVCRVCLGSRVRGNDKVARVFGLFWGWVCWYGLRGCCRIFVGGWCAPFVLRTFPPRAGETLVVLRTVPPPSGGSPNGFFIAALAGIGRGPVL